MDVKMIRKINGKEYIAHCTAQYTLEYCNEIKNDLREKGLKVRTLDYVKENGKSYARVFIEMNEAYKNLNKLMNTNEIKKLLKKYEKYISVRKISRYSVQVDCTLYHGEIYYELHKAGYKVVILESSALKTRLSVRL